MGSLLLLLRSSPVEPLLILFIKGMLLEQLWSNLRTASN